MAMEMEEMVMEMELLPRVPHMVRLMLTETGMVLAAPVQRMEHLMETVMEMVMEMVMETVLEDRAMDNQVQHMVHLVETATATVLKGLVPCTELLTEMVTETVTVDQVPHMVRLAATVTETGMVLEDPVHHMEHLMETVEEVILAVLAACTGHLVGATDSAGVLVPHTGHPCKMDSAEAEIMGLAEAVAGLLELNQVRLMGHQMATVVVQTVKIVRFFLSTF